MRSARIFTALAALSLAGTVASPEAREAQAVRDKQPPPDRLPPPRTTRPKYADEVTDADLDRLTKAIAKRERKAAKLRRALSSGAPSEQDLQGE